MEMGGPWGWDPEHWTPFLNVLKMGADTRAAGMNEWVSERVPAPGYPEVWA